MHAAAIESGRAMKAAGIAPAHRDARLEEATRELVGSVFYGTLLRTMRQSDLKGKFGHGGRGEEAFAGQLDAMLAERAGRATRGGLAETLYEHLEKQQRLMDRRSVTPGLDDTA